MDLFSECQCEGLATLGYRDFPLEFCLISVAERAFLHLMWYSELSYFCSAMIALVLS